MIEKKVNLVVQYLLQMPNTPVCLIGIRPNQDTYFLSSIHSHKNQEMVKSMQR